MFAVLGGGKDRSGSAVSVTHTTRLSQGGTMRALIIGSGEGRGTLAAARGLASAGGAVGLGGPTHAAVPMLSRARSPSHWVPALNAGSRGFLLAIKRAIVARRYDPVFLVGRAPAPGGAHA